MLNRVEIMGRLTKDPELRYTTSGTPVAAFTLAVERDYSDQDGEKPVDFIDCIAWRNTAEFLSKYFSKGRMVVAAGRLQVRYWEDSQGKNRKIVEVVAENVYFGDSKKDTDSNGGYQSQYSNYGASSPGSNTGYSELGGEAGEIDDELPF